VLFEGVVHRQVVLTVPKRIRPLILAEAEFLKVYMNAGAAAVKELIEQWRKKRKIRVGIMAVLQLPGLRLDEDAADTDMEQGRGVGVRVDARPVCVQRTGRRRFAGAGGCGEAERTTAAGSAGTVGFRILKREDHGVHGLHGMKHEELSAKIIGAAQAVLYELKPGLDEKLYENALVIEPRERGMQVDQQKRYDVRYKGHLLGTLIPDLIVDSTVIVDTKVVSAFNETHVAQMLVYLSITGLDLALLLNFKGARLGVKRVVK
jgi:GxxExxY protein